MVRDIGVFLAASAQELKRLLPGMFELLVRVICMMLYDRQKALDCFQSVDVKHINMWDGSQYLQIIHRQLS